MRRHMAAGGSLWEAPLYQEKFARQGSGFCRKQYVLWRGGSKGSGRAKGAKRVQAQPGGQSPLLCPRLVGAGGSMGSDAFCVRILRKDGPAPQARRVRGFNPAGQPAFMRTCRIRGGRRASPRLCRASPIRRARGIPMGSDALSREVRPSGQWILKGSDTVL